MNTPPPSTTDSNVLLSMRGISKTYGAIRALREVNFEVRAGEVMALLGENGAGKSTLVKVLAGLVKPDAGKVDIAGSPLEPGSSRQSQEAGVAVVQQEHSSVGTLPIAENLILGQSGSGVIWTKRRLAARAKPLLEAVGLDHLDAWTPVEQLSVAETQLLEIARVLARDARILVFDEPTAALSDAEIERVLAVVKRLADEGRSVIYVTHRLPEVFRIGDRITILRDGMSLPPMGVSAVTVGDVVTKMLGRELAAMYPERTTPGAEIRLRAEAIRAAGLREPVTLTVRQGEILGLAGQLGSGASALVQALAGTAGFAGGNLFVDGRETSMGSRADGIAGGVAYCSADRKRDGIFSGVSILRNLSSPWLHKVSRSGVVSHRHERHVASRIATKFAVDVRRLGSPVSTLSGGNQQKVALGKWLGAEPSVLLVEEPTRGVDVGARAEIYQHLRDLCQSGLAVVVSSSDTAEIIGLCDTIATFYHGRMTAIRSHDQWTEEEVVQHVMHEEGIVA